MKVVVVSGYFDPIHSGHIEYFELAKKLGDKLIVILNNDEQAILKKGKVFMPLEDRKKVLEAIRYIDEVFVSIDTKSIGNHRPIIESLKVLNARQKIHIFAKGGDRFAHEIPEAELCKELGIEIIDGVGKKIQSSSNFYNNADN